MIKIYLKAFEDTYSLLAKQRKKFSEKQVLKNREKFRDFAWGFLASVLKEQYNIDFNKSTDLLYTDDGKPYIKNDPIYFNITYSHNVVAVAISDTKVGLDLQCVSSFKGQEWKLRKAFSKNERKEIRHAKFKHQTMSMFWTRKEAYIKMKGLNPKKEALDKITVNPNNQWLLLEANDSYFLTAINKVDDIATELILDKNIKVLQRFKKGN